ncbi:energy-coupling factor transporter transmembrane component T family protein [Halanaeroarchaeum sulfurireducens]|uniref:Cobalt ABC transporter permease n=1 Tax=Halanaeroarchaeum sulfurireducens TaxID=1604004 RepID=A0A0F7PB90_9EURY|nr:energy-coupling factor transporter transmembrane component T [Halanaeroarchaeum sulfurireducens]AKH96603.1 cobalt ABC transporter permease [Halanaeroarchaeum sulfurireducens]ALG81005.1 cobalt ABC transporter permease [Halanaeroarchaeum sulfurireducens]
MLSYDPGTGMARRLDPRTKLLFQVGFAVAAFESTHPRGLVALTLVVGWVLVASRIGPVEALGEYGPFVPFLFGAPLLAGLTLGPPWFVPADTVDPALASYRSVLLLAVGAAYVKTTPVRDSRAAVAWLVPGRVGRGLALGIGFVFRLLPLLQADLRRSRDAARARLGGTRPLHERMRVVALDGLRRATGRADGLAVALRARCLAWNPTPPPMALAAPDYAVLAGTAGVVLVAVW